MDRFVRVVESDDFSLAEAFLAFAQAKYRTLDVDAYLARLPAPGGSFEAVGAALVDAGFRGNTETYYAPENSFLNEVLDRKLGIPISLSVLWIEAGRAAGLPTVGVGMPMHFLAGLESEDVYGDLYNGGRVIGRDEAVALFGSVTGGRLPWNDRYLVPTPPRDIVRRALNNLKAIYGTSGQMRNALWVENHILAIPGTDASEHRERATVLAALGRYKEAIADLRVYQATEPDDADAVGTEIRRLMATMN